MTFLAIGVLYAAIEIFGLPGAGVARLAVELVTMMLMTLYTLKHMRAQRNVRPSL
jgi:hypothetical protein